MDLDFSSHFVVVIVVVVVVIVVIVVIFTGDFSVFIFSLTYHCNLWLYYSLLSAKKYFALCNIKNIYIFACVL